MGSSWAPCYRQGQSITYDEEVYSMCQENNFYVKVLDIGIPATKTGRSQQIDCDFITVV